MKGVLKSNIPPLLSLTFFKLCKYKIAQLCKMQRVEDISWFLLEILLINEFYNLIGWKARLATSNQKS